MIFVIFHFLRRSFCVFFLAFSICIFAQNVDSNVKLNVEELIKKLETSGANKAEIHARREAALALSKLGIGAIPAVSALISALEDSDTQVWFHSVTALSRIGEAAIPAIPALIEDLKSDERRGVQSKWYRSAYALGNMGSGAIPKLLPALNHPHPRVRSGVALALGWIGKEAAAAIHPLIVLLKDEDANVRKHSAEALAKIGESSLPLLESALLENQNDQDVNAQLAALKAIGRLRKKSQTLFETLLNLTKSSNPILQSEIIKTMAQLDFDPQKTLHFLLPFSQHDDKRVRFAVADAILSIPPKHSISALLERLDFEDPSIQIWAAELLGKIGSPAAIAVPILIDRLARNVDSARENVFCKALSAIGISSMNGIFLHASKLGEEDLHPDHWIVQSLAHQGIPAIAPLIRGLENPNASLRLACIFAIGKMGADARSTAQKMHPLLRDPNPRIRAASLTNLILIAANPNLFSSEIAQMLGDESAHVRQAAAKAIPNISDISAETIERLGDLLEDDDEWLRLASANALASVGRAASSQSRSLEMLLADDEKIKMAAIGALGKLGQSSDFAIHQIAHLAHQNGSTRLIALECLGRLKASNERSIRAFRKAVSDESEKVREIAISYFSQVVNDFDEIIAVSVAALDDDVLSVRLAAANNLGNLKEAAASAIPSLMARLADNQNISKYLDALRKIPAQEMHLEHYENALEHRSPIVRAYASEQLGELGEAALPAAQTLARLAKRDGSRYVRERAKNAYEQIIGK